MDNQSKEISAPSLLSLFETNREQRQSFAQQVLGYVKDGGADPRQILLQSKCITDMMSLITDDEEFKQMLITESEKNGRRHEYMNAEFNIREAGVKYDYSNCNDTPYNELVAEKEKLDAKIKDRERFLKNVPTEGTTIVDESTGEAITVYPPSKSSKTIVSVTLK